MIFENVTEQLRGSDIFDRFVKAGELCCGRLADVRNGESEKPARQRQRSRAFDCINCFGRVFLAENARRFIRTEIEFRELLSFQLKQIERVAN